ncbi:alpha/beta fold hydrolase [Actinoplanes sp. NPDC024001]|uniref:alpha/beta fold hydrolase n=1 Tax=Actinoplanes sp. NPDC024001 TaxID=3154598 RepID=UPI0033DDCE39
MTLAHDVTGSGPAVLLLHSTVGDRRMWDPQMSALSDAGYRVIRCDFRGYGETPMPSEPNDDTQDVADLLSHLGVDRLAVIGSSGGGRVALDFAARSPERITALALLCTAAPGHEPSAELRAFGKREDALLEAGDVDGATELNVDLWVGPEADETVRAQVRAMQRNAFQVQLAAEKQAVTDTQPAPEDQPTADTQPALEGQPTADTQPAPKEQPTADTQPTAGEQPAADEPPVVEEQSAADRPPAAGDQPAEGEQPRAEADPSAITAPTLLVSGAHDLPDFQQIATDLAARLPHARHLHLDWAGHLPSLERPDLINPLLIDFLAESKPEN